MQLALPRAYALELVGSFGVVLFSAGLVCINQTVSTVPPPSGLTPVTLHQPGLFGLAVGQGLIWAAMLALTAGRTGGYLNPVLTIMLMIGRQLPVMRGIWLIGAQLLGAVAAGACLQGIFRPEILNSARYGVPHLNPLVYPVFSRAILWSGFGVEVALTFFFALAIFANKLEAGPAFAWCSGAVLTVGVLFAFPLTGAVVNPAHWFGTVLWEWAQTQNAERAFQDCVVYLAGPAVGAAAAWMFCRLVLVPAEAPV